MHVLGTVPGAAGPSPQGAECEAAPWPPAGGNAGRASPRIQPYCVGTMKLPLLPSSPFSASCSSFSKGVTFLCRTESLGTRAEAGRRGPAYSGCSSWVVALMWSSFWKVLWSFGDVLSKG